MRTIDRDKMQTKLLDMEFPIQDQDPILDAMDACTFNLPPNDPLTLENLLERVRGPRWISVKARLPEPCKNVLVLYDVDTDIDIRSKVDISYREEGKTRFEFEDIYGPATHWMPLPDLPEEVE